MTVVRIVCTHDAVKFAEALARLLGAEGDDVRINYGRQSLDALSAACEAPEAVLLVWSYDAPSVHYMLEWAKAIPPERLVEIGRAHGWPPGKRYAPVIDFTAWRGERGGRAWNALSERLRAVYRIVDPQPEPLRAPAIGVGVVGAVAAGVAIVIGMQPAHEPKEIALEPQKVTLALMDGDGMGGPMDSLEPASIGDSAAAPPRAATIAPRPNLIDISLSDIEAEDPSEVRARLDVLGPPTED